MFWGLLATQEQKKKKSGVISPKELSEAELCLFKWSQQTLEKDKLDKNFIPSEDEQELVHAHGRLENIWSLPNELRNPIILPKGHQLVHLHEKRAHCGSKSLIYESRRRFWIIGVHHMASILWQNVWSAISWWASSPKEELQWGSQHLTTQQSPCLNCYRSELGQKTLKEAHAIIFTCITTRAVHLELVTKRSTDTSLMAFRRFTSSRGNPNNCWYNCGLNFIGLQTTWRKSRKNGTSQKFTLKCQSSPTLGLPQARDAWSLSVIIRSGDVTHCFWYVKLFFIG